MWRLLVSVLALLDTPAQYRCLTYNGHTECGYRCEATGGEMGCAQTAQGICVTASGHVTCWDPPEWVRAHYRDRVPPPECLTRGGVTACGYKCRAHNGEVACAQSPDGVCGNSPDDLVCWDPSPELYCIEVARALPPARCLVHDGKIACGYACEGRGGALGCAASPTGTCVVEKGEVRCFDAPIPVVCEEGKPCAAGVDPRPWCPRVRR